MTPFEEERRRREQMLQSQDLLPGLPESGVGLEPPQEPVPVGLFDQPPPNAMAGMLNRRLGVMTGGSPSEENAADDERIVAGQMAQAEQSNAMRAKVAEAMTAQRAANPKKPTLHRVEYMAARGLNADKTPIQNLMVALLEKSRGSRAGKSPEELAIMQDRNNVARERIDAFRNKKTGPAPEQLAVQRERIAAQRANSEEITKRQGLGFKNAAERDTQRHVLKIDELDELQKHRKDLLADHFTNEKTIAGINNSARAGNVDRQIVGQQVRQIGAQLQDLDVHIINEKNAARKAALESLKQAKIDQLNQLMGASK